MENGRMQLYVTKMTLAILWVFTARSTLEGTVNRAHFRVAQSLFTRSSLCVILEGVLLDRLNIKR
jgi:hypothetical protein